MCSKWTSCPWKNADSLNKKIYVGVLRLTVKWFLLPLPRDPWRATEAWWQLYESTCSILFFIGYVREVVKSSSFHRHVFVSVCSHVHLSVRVEQFVSQDGFLSNFCILVLYKICRANWSLVIFRQNKEILNEDSHDSLITDITVGYFDSNRY